MVAGRPFDPAAALRIIDQIAQALEAAHTHGIVHLDLKPDNVILLSIDGHDDFVKVIDFGISRATWRAGVIDESLVTGTPEYMAPEQARGAGEDIDHRADQFSLAAVAYALLTGHEPFEGPSLAALLDQVIHQTQQPPSQRAPWLGPEVDGVVGRGMSKQAVDRYPGVMVFSEALRAALEGVDVAPYAARFTMPPEAFPASASGQELASPAPGRDTRRFIRRAHRKMRTRRSGSVLVALAAVAAFAWFSPPTRDATRAVWRRARAEAGLLVNAPAAGHAAASSSSPSPSP
jgi:serine/threonine protein kinase